jgi:hypothetical protein
MRLPLLAAILALSSSPMFCQPHLEDPSRELEQMTKRYKLDADQRNEIKPILESEAEDIQTILKKPPSGREAKLRETHALCNREIDAVLHPRQRQLFERDQSLPAYQTDGEHSSPLQAHR